MILENIPNCRPPDHFSGQERPLDFLKRLREPGIQLVNADKIESLADNKFVDLIVVVCHYGFPSVKTSSDSAWVVFGITHSSPRLPMKLLSRARAYRSGSFLTEISGFLREPAGARSGKIDLGCVISVALICYLIKGPEQSSGTGMHWLRNPISALFSFSTLIDRIGKRRHTALPPVNGSSAVRLVCLPRRRPSRLFFFSIVVGSPAASRRGLGHLHSLLLLIFSSCWMPGFLPFVPHLTHPGPIRP